jgi:plasmid stabilization system protein ParE
MRVIYSPQALADLSLIRDYLGQHSRAAASRVAVQLVAACDSLEHLPERGRPGLIAGTREVTLIWPYVIVYEVKPEKVGDPAHLAWRPVSRRLAGRELPLTTSAELNAWRCPK